MKSKTQPLDTLSLRILVLALVFCFAVSAAEQEEGASAAEGEAAATEQGDEPAGADDTEAADAGDGDEEAEADGGADEAAAESDDGGSEEAAEADADAPATISESIATGGESGAAEGAGEEAEAELDEPVEEVDINSLLDLPEEQQTTVSQGAADDDPELDLSFEDQLPDDVSDRPSARGIGGKKEESGPTQAIETEEVDTSQAEAEAERQRMLQEKEAEILARQKELERRQRIERGLDEQIQDLKDEALLLGEELRLLSEQLIHPASTQVTIFLSLKESDKDYLLDSVELKMNGQLVGSHLYTLREIDALRRGGVQRIYDGNLRAGEHFLELTVNGREDDEVNTLNWRYDFSKGSTPHFVELGVFDNRITAKSW